MTLKSGIVLSLLFSLLLSQSGCTGVLWTEEKFDAYKEPTPNPNLKLYASKQGQDVLVVYSEYSERENTTHTRAYWLGRNEARVEDKHKPHFVNSKAINEMTEVPVFYGSLNTNCLGFYAICATNGPFFKLYTEKREVGSYELPVYKDMQGTVEKIALTPVTASADVAMVSGVVGFCVLYEWAQSGLTIRVGK